MIGLGLGTYVADDLQLAVDAVVVETDGSWLSRGGDGAVDDLVRGGDDRVCRGEVEGEGCSLSTDIPAVTAIATVASGLGCLGWLVR